MKIFQSVFLIYLIICVSPDIVSAHEIYLSPAGKDQHSIIADPLFVNPAGLNFHLKNLSAVKKIKFTPFDYSKAGVYGSNEWKELAKADPELERKFDKIVEKCEMGTNK